MHNVDQCGAEDAEDARWRDGPASSSSSSPQHVWAKKVVGTATVELVDDITSR